MATLVLKPGRYRGYSVRRAKRPLMVGLAAPCALCLYRLSEFEQDWFWNKRGRWESKCAACPECGTLNEFIAVLRG